MNSSGSSVDIRDKCENEFSEFLLKRLRNAGGKLPLQHVTGHLSQLSYDVRLTIGTSKTDLVHFLMRHTDLFSVHDGVVKIVDSVFSNNGDYDSDGSSIEPQSSLPEKIKKGKGVIIKIFPEFGFIKAKEPVKTVVFFKSISYGNKDIDLTGSLYVGAMVYFDAKKKNNERSKYFATKVWKVDENDMHSSIIVQKARKNRDTGLYDPMTLDSEGVIQNVFPNLGFIAVKGDVNNTVFFHKNRLLKYDNIVDLTKVLSKGDIVEFTAHRSTKQDAKARWEATKVWKKTSKIKEEFGIPKSDSKDSHGNHSSVSKTDMKNKSSAKEMIKNQRGKICPRSQGAVIKFGQNELADGDGSDYYISGCQVHDISWEFSEGDDVFFDAVKIKSAPGWKAVLVWVGEKPDVVLPTCLGDFSAFTDDETDDNLSSYMSYSSNSSVKSESSLSKNRKIQKGTSSRLSSGNREVQKHNLKHELHDSSSQNGSQSSLSSSVKSKSSQRSRKEHKGNFSNKILNAENKSVSCWGDSPYPADDSYSNVSASHDSYLYLSAADDNYPNVSASDNNECNSSMMLSHTTVRNEKGQSKSKHSSSSVEEEIIEKEFPLPSEDISNSESTSKEKRCKEKAISESTSKVKVMASVKKFRTLEGKIIKVYSKYAEVKPKELDKIVSFFWNNFYFNGVSIEELELDDLKQVLKVGDAIYFNYFEIVDDSGQNWQKVTLAWKGSRPKKVIELSPEDFINQNSLSVNINCEKLDGKEEDNAACRKYLAAVDNLSPDEAESYSEDESLTSADHSDVLNKTPDKAVSSAIIQILKKNVFPSNLKVDLNFIAEEIINIVLENDAKKCDEKFCQTLPPNETLTSNITCTDCGKTFMLNSGDDVNTKNSEVQTIITGEIIAQNIFTEC